MSEELTVYSLGQIPELHVLGRTDGALQPLTVFWTAGGIELNTTGTQLWLLVESDYENYEPWISVLVNGAPVSRQPLIKGQYWLCIYRGMPKEEIKNVRVIRDVQAMSGDPASCLQFHALKNDGEFYKVEDKKLRIEFIGDSITSGEGTIGAKKEESWISMWFSAVNNYSTMTAGRLDADYRVISQSGWGVLSSWDGNPYFVLSAGYEKVCGVLSGEKNDRLGAARENDFQAWQPDVVVVNLGTNDSGAFYAPEWRDEASGITFKQHLEADGTFCPRDVSRFETAVVDFLIKIRRYNQKAHMIWAYGMVGTPMLTPIRRAVEEYRLRTGDKRVSVVVLPEMTAETAGSRCHPGTKAHALAAEVLSEEISRIINQL